MNIIDMYNIHLMIEIRELCLSCIYIYIYITIVLALVYKYEKSTTFKTIRRKKV